MRRAEVLFELEKSGPVKLPNEVPDEANFGPTPGIYVEYNFSIKNTLQGSYGEVSRMSALGNSDEGSCRSKKIEFGMHSPSQVSAT